VQVQYEQVSQAATAVVFLVSIYVFKYLYCWSN